jgi:5'-hydroxyaverantin dehydrogenase
MSIPSPASSSETPHLANKSILITGGASGLGLATVRAVAAAGAHVTIATNVKAANGILRELEAAGYHIQEVVCNVTDWNSLVAAFKAALAFSPTGMLDIVAMFAAVDKSPNIIDQIRATTEVSMEVDPTPPDSTSIDVNLKGTFYTTALALHYFRLQPKGTQNAAQDQDKSLIFVSSLAGYIDDTHNSSYTASKFGARGLWRSIRARATSEMGVRCNLIAPWAMKTPMTAPILEVMENLGIKEGAGITFAKEETLVQAMMRCIGDKSVTGWLNLQKFGIARKGSADT